MSTFFIQLAFAQCPAFNQRRQMYFTLQNTFLHIATRQTSIAAAARRYFSTFLSPFQPSPFTRRFPFLPSSLSSISCPTRGTFVASELYAGWIHPWGGGLGTRVNSALTIRYWLNCYTLNCTVLYYFLTKKINFEKNYCMRYFTYRYQCKWIRCDLYFVVSINSF